MSPHHREIGFVTFNRVPSTLQGHERCAVSDPESRSDHGPRYPCTQCGQLCGQLWTIRGQAWCSRIRPHFTAGVPTGRHHLSTSAPRSLACGNGAASTPSTLLTTAVVVISSRTLLFTSVGDERLGRGGPPANRPRTALSTTGPGKVFRGVLPGPVAERVPTPGTSRVWFGRTVGRPVARRPGLPSARPSTRKPLCPEFRCLFQLDRDRGGLLDEVPCRP